MHIFVFMICEVKMLVYVEFLIMNYFSIVRAWQSGNQ